MAQKIPGIEQLSQESQALYDAVNEEPDLPCVLISTSYLDQCLASLLERHFISGKTAKRLLDPRGGPIGTFSVRADICYCLGIISKDLYNNLRTVAEIRNRFAHSYLSISFDDSEVAILCEQLTFPEVALSKRTEGDTGDTYDVENPFERFKGPRVKFTVNAVLMANRLLLIGLGLKKGQ
jgi:DNA-binding MltR family transcriptional regulator